MHAVEAVQPQRGMSSVPNAQPHSAPTPPLRGSFPLDHEHQCTALAKAYLACLKEHRSRKEGSSATACKAEARGYLECRMAHGLMDVDDLDALGFKTESTDSREKRE